MRRLRWLDEAGRIQFNVVRRAGDDPRLGIPVGIPDVSALGLNPETEVALHNALVQAELFSWHDVMVQQSAVTDIVQKLARQFNLSQAVAGHIRRTVLGLYRLRR